MTYIGWDNREYEDSEMDSMLDDERDNPIVGYETEEEYLCTEHVDLFKYFNILRKKDRYYFPLKCDVCGCEIPVTLGEIDL